MRRVLVLSWVLLVGCSNGGRGGSEDPFGSASPEPCTPGEQRACACPGGAPDGVQVCASTGDHFEPCTGCGSTDGGDASSTAGASEGPTATGGPPATSTEPGDDTSTGEGACAGHCTNGIQDCDEPAVDCGPGCPSDEYTFCDCLIDTPRNGSEVCDDTGFVVPAESPPNVLVCLEATGGQIYVATNTSIDPTDGAPRCSGWELMGQNAWDYLDYVVPPLTCDAVQKTQPFDISGYAGQTLWFGAHDNPAGGGSGTTACIALAK